MLAFEYAKAQDKSVIYSYALKLNSTYGWVKFAYKVKNSSSTQEVSPHPSYYLANVPLPFPEERGF